MNDADFDDVLKAARNFDGYPRPWAVCGGWAIDLFLGRNTRSHKDVDFAVLRKDQLVLQEQLVSKGWTLEKATQGQLVTWERNEWISLPVHTIWCKNPKSSPDFIELLFEELDGKNYLYRREPSITIPMEKVIVSSQPGVPILAPEVVLLYKSGRPEDPSAMHDFRNILPRLSHEAREWLAAALRELNAGHVWLKELL